MTSPDSAESLDAKALVDKVTALREACIEAKTVSEGLMAEGELRHELLEEEALLQLLRLARLGMKAEAGWIPCGERMPEKGVEVLVAQAGSDKYGVCHWAGAYWWQRGVGRLTADPTHWMPLPAPPAEREGA